ncbi:unnamed protein product, partial [Mesorhabditis belari]|uniref:Carboxylesterase type B domain-containing protein n=1 Tax=Mesorhabditis belari TaxID=2138241 RepID=A0AAF3EZ42_9BILA
MKLFLFLSLISCIYSQFAFTSLGTVRGITTKSTNGVSVEVYKGLPFAKPPIGKLRYAKPEEPTKWQGIRDATDYQFSCLSNSSQTSSPQSHIDEDCLYVNIFTSARCKKTRNCAVLVYIHGGALLYDSATMFPDNHLIDHFAAKDVVLVITAFRMSTWGLFASPFEEVTPHNLAIHDIVRSLEFVQKEIWAFGGDPRRVTSLGHSMGADLSLAIAYSEELNPGNRILAQASAMSPSMDYHDIDRMHETSFEFARRAKCTPPGSTKFETPAMTKAIVECLRTKPWQELLLIQREIDDDGLMYLNGFPLTHPLTSSGRLDLLLKNAPKTPVLLGSTMLEFDPVGLPNANETYGDILQLKNTQEIAIKLYYDQVTERLKTHHNYQSQCVFVSTFNYGKAQIERGAQAFLYKYDMPRGCQHTGDLCYVMGVHCRDFNDDELKIKEFYSEYFVNFTKHGKPRADWEPLDPSRKNYWSVVCNQTIDLYPHNENNYEAEVVDYWLKNMTFFDKKVTEIKERIMPNFEALTFDSIPSYANFISICLFVIVLFPGVLLGFVILMKVTKKNEYDALPECEDLDQKNAIVYDTARYL